MFYKFVFSLNTLGWEESVAI